MRRPGIAVVVIIAALAASAADAATSLARLARLEGRFAMSGHVTAARHIRGEHVGERVTRTWTFTPLCPTGPCRRIALGRQRAAGADSLVLTRRAAGVYMGRGRFFAPLECGGRRQPRGELVPFTVKVRITQTASAGAGRFVTRIHAAYTNVRRVNRTRCVALPGHDSAVYSGTFVATNV
jgi:hypothetical protein